ncbi:hypothetical protein L226DRAFT_570544 [Lentinus tigrinus ALCF2SS1-7]|uniref:uncharacterized protein n=1 Tax=Lentinus tigrinus ALCF2SS1-7 TaxID=1328758 RepID=UPI001166329A|nr:hypothetical protein L226DRAFT_570544 [Lentinus tigrinus ALCF2SS1-7]
MAQSGYSTYYPQTAYAYPTPQPQAQAYDPRLQQQYATHYQQAPYSQPAAQQQYPYAHNSSPLPQRPPSRIDPIPYAPGQPNGPLSSPLSQQPQYGQYYPPRSPQPYMQPPAANPYPSPVSPQTPQTPQSGTPQSSRRPLPDPRGLPLPPSNGQGYAAPQQTPSPGPYAGTHRPTQSVPSTFSVDTPPNPLSRIPSGQGGSPTSSGFSVTSTSSPRPLPLPRSAGSFDLASSQSQPVVQPQSPPKRALPEPHPSPTREQPVRSPEPQPAPGQKFVPMWRRALPQPGGSAIAASTPSHMQAPIERRSTVSGSARPLPSPGQCSNAVVAQKDSLARTGTLPPHLQLQNVPPTPQSPVQPPDPPLRVPRSAVAPNAATSPSVSRFSARERSRTLPLPTAAPSYPLPPQPTNTQTPAFGGEPVSESPISSDDEELTNALLERHPRSPSPQFGIRDLPSRSSQSSHGGGGQVETTPRARRELPSPGPPSSSQGETSLAMRMAAVSLRSTSPSPTFRPTHGHSQSLSNTNGSRPMPQPPSPSKQQQGGWPAALPPLPKAPVSPTPVSAPPTQSTFAQMQARALPQPTRSNTSAATSTPFSRPRSPRKGELDLSLDDAPPPSLRRSPAPSSSFSQPPSRPPGSFNSQLPHAPAMSSRSQTAPSSSTAVRRTPSDATSVFSLSNFPAPPRNEPASPTKPAFRPPSPTKTNQRPPSPAKPQFSARPHSPVKFQPPAPSRQQSQGTPRIPKISFPASADGDSDEDDMDGGPLINISGPSGAPPSLPRISFDDDGGGVPSINIGGADDGPSIPQISLPGEPSSSPPKKNQAQTRKMQEALSNPRLEAAKRSGLVCGGCGGPIIGRIVSAMDMRWHPGCFRCCVCDELLENLSSYAHDGRPYCHLDYHEQFAPRCYHCQTAIVDERFITLDDTELGKRTYHEQHFFCAECGDPFLPPSSPGAPSRTFAGDGAFTASADDDVGFTVYKGHPYCEACHVRLRMPKCKKCKKSIRDGMQAVEALGGKWCWECFTCASCDKPFENPAFFQRDGKPFCERCFSIMIRNEI